MAFVSRLSSRNEHGAKVGGAGGVALALYADRFSRVGAVEVRRLAAYAGGRGNVGMGTTVERP